MTATVLATGLSARALAAEEPARPERQVALVRVQLPLKGNADQHLQAKLERLRDHLIAEAKQAGTLGRPSLVLQLQPARDTDGTGSQFERVLSLSRFLCSKMTGVRTVAFLPKTVRGHGALLAVACEEIVMAPEAEIGEAGIDEADEETIRKTVRAAYQEIADARRTLPVALAVGMVDASVKVLQIETEEGTHFILGSELEEFARGHEVIQETTLVSQGTLAMFSGREGRQFGFVKFLANDRDGLADALGVSPDALQEDDTLRAEWVPMMVDISGPITPRSAGQLETILGTELQRGTINWIGVRIDSSGGDLAASLRMAMALARVDTNSVRTVAYVSAEATGGAALVALSCDQLVMHPGASLSAGIVEEMLPGKQHDGQRKTALDAATTSIRESLAPRTERSWSLLSATIDPSVEIAQYRNQATGEQRWMSAEEVALAKQAKNWKWVAALNKPGQPLTLDGTKAEQIRLAWKTVENFEGLKDLFGFEEDPPVVEPNWALELIEALASPEFAMLLLMVAFAGIYFEMRAPGMGLGGFVAAVAFLLFFWSKYLHGTAGWLEALLFVAGVGFILLEIFVLPGFGVSLAVRIHPRAIF